MKRIFHIAAPLTAVVLTVNLLGGLQGNLLSEVAQAKAPKATLDSMEVWCDATVISGHIDVPAPYVRLNVSTSTPITTIADIVVPVQPDGSFTGTAYYPLQPANSHLVGFYTEWDGSQGLDSTMWGEDCVAPTSRPTLLAPANSSTTGNNFPTFD